MVNESAIPAHLLSRDACELIAGGICYGHACYEPVKRADTGRWFITMGHPGFNSPANNRAGYASSARAFAALKRYGGAR